MSEGGFKGVVKGGWHPKSKDGKSQESWRGDFKGINQVAGWMGKGKGASTSDSQSDHISVPISSLKDPSSFGPPPKNVNFHGGAAVPNRTTPDTRGWGAPLSQDELQRQNAAKAEAAHEEEQAANKAPPVPYRTDTTGLSTANLPKPPGRRDGADGRSPLPPPSGSKPKPPPRLPPRQNSNPGPNAPDPPPSYGAATAEPPSHQGIMNPASLNRLGAAGVSVSALGIGTSRPTAAASPKPFSSSSTTNSSLAAGAQMNELQSRFSRMGSSSSSSPRPAAANPTAGGGTSMAQKQAAVRTASAFRNDPSSVSLADARSAASTANNFRERHGEQVAAGWNSANRLNAKYGIADRVGSYSGSVAPAPVSPSAQVQQSTQSPLGGLATGPSAFKKKAPPPPKKRADLAAASASSAGNGVPPPIPLASKPKPQVSDLP